ncbi:MAG: M28 family peptidase, partial [Alphaproteobacteria bacterium]|nr:M28 family peptidase [Alphaproteobacteria bacterium]
MNGIDQDGADERLMRFLSIEGVTGQEGAIGQEIRAALAEAGVPARAMRFDAVNKDIPLATETGNLIVTLPGRGAHKGSPRLLFSTHMDTVPLAAGARPKRQGSKIVNAAKGAALGGDNRTGCGVLVTLASELMRRKPDHPPITLLFTVREESGLWGARMVDKADLGGATMGFNFDGRNANSVTIGA